MNSTAIAQHACLTLQQGSTRSQMPSMESSLQKPVIHAESSALALGPEPRVDFVLETQDFAVTSSHSSPGCRLVYLLSIFPGVSHTFFLNEVRELRRQGFNVEVASINQPDVPGSSMLETEAEEMAKTFYIKSSGARQAIWVAIRTLLRWPRVFARGLTAALRLGRWDLHATVKALFYFAEALILGDWMRSRGRRHLHIHFCGPVATVGMLASIAWRFSFSLTVHGPDEFYNVEDVYLREKVESAKFIFCISDFCRSQLMRLVDPAHWEKMNVVRLGVDPDVFRPTRSEQSPRNVLEVLCVGRLVPSKGQLILLQACNLLLSRGYSFQVRLVGAGPDRKLLQTFARQNSIPVIFEGAKNSEEIRQLLGRADVFALASFAEGVPVALMEAMAMEVPCVSTYVAGIPELIRNGFDGLLVPASSTEAMASALQQLLDDPLLRREFGVAGSRRVHEFYNLPRNVSFLASMFRQLVSESPLEAISGYRVQP
jgi:colanic acid/amylovoran biosynthesis glycosyltransferase